MGASGLDSLADLAAFFGAVGGHPFAVGLAFTGLGPVDAGLVTLGFVGFLVCVFAGIFDSGTLVSVLFARFTARLHTVGSHPLSVLGAFTFLGPSMARGVGVLDT